MAFTHNDVYCIAPIVHKDSELEYYDLWAVGKNCCSTADPQFNCDMGPYQIVGLFHSSEASTFNVFACSHITIELWICCAATVFTNCPQVIILKLRIFMDDGCNAVYVIMCEGH